MALVKSLFKDSGNMKHTLTLTLFFLIFFLIVQSIIVQATLFAPGWMKTDAYASYELKAITITFSNNSFLDFKEEKEAILRWECIETKETTAELKISLEIKQGNGNIYLTNNVYVDTVNRTVSLANGSSIGKTRLWAPSNPDEGTEISLYSNSSDEVRGVATTVFNDKPIFFETAYGYQRVFTVEGNGTIDGQQTLFVPIVYDFDTGVMINDLTKYEAMLLALDIKELMGNTQLVDTNIDLGPREISFDITAMLPFVAVIVAVIIIFVTVYIRLRKRKH